MPADQQPDRLYSQARLTRRKGPAIDSLKSSVEILAGLIRGSGKTVVLTGAGISTPSGIPDFRSPGNGLWENIDPFQVLSLTTFQRDPAVFYDWLHPLAVKLETAVPNPAHLALARLEEMGYLQAVLTQNIDGLHQKAGSRLVFELHGSLEKLACLKCGLRRDSAPFREAFLVDRQLPLCPDCRAVLKPEIVFFEEMLPQHTWTASEELAASSDLMLVMGSSLEVVPANQLPLTAVRHGARLAILNRMPTPYDRLAECSVSASLEEVLPLLAESLTRNDFQ